MGLNPDNPRRLPAEGAIEVYVSDVGYVCIKSYDPVRAEEHVIALEPSRAAKVIRWMQECLEEIGRD